MGKLTSPDLPNPTAISSRIKSSISPYQVDHGKLRSEALKKIKVIIDFFCLDKKKGSVSPMKEMVSNSIPTVFIECLLSVKVLWNGGGGGLSAIRNISL